jgi:hypothetical protein
MTPYFVTLCAALTVFDTIVSAAFQSDRSLRSDVETLSSARFKEESTDVTAITAMAAAMPRLGQLPGKLHNMRHFKNEVLSNA